MLACPIAASPGEDVWLLPPGIDGGVCWKGEGAIVPEDYDFSRSTEDAHTADDQRLVGPFAAIRARLDYSYHHYYKESRQHVQDCIVQLLLRTLVVDADGTRTCDRPERPWLVFTAGAMGAGKSHVLRWLWTKGYFPLEAFVQSNPDQIRRMLPETSGYLARNPATAGTHTHKEAGYVAEVVTLAALERGKNALVDGSLRNATWYSEYIGHLRREHPRLQLAILHVTASEAAVMSRASKRSEQTGRSVPMDVLLRTLRAVPGAVTQLSPLVDYSVAIENEGAEPVLRTPGQTWQSFQERFLQRCGPEPPAASGKDEQEEDKEENRAREAPLGGQGVCKAEEGQGEAVGGGRCAARARS